MNPSPSAPPTIADWRQPPHQRLAFRQAPAILSTAVVAHDPAQAAPLPAAPIDWSDFRVDARGTPMDLVTFLRRTHSDGFLVLQHGRIVGEWWDEGMAASTSHILMSATKSVVGLLSGVLGARWKGRVQEDERDREIEKRAAGWGRGALIACIVGLALMLAFSPAERLAWATHFMIANLLVFALMWGWLCEYVATAMLYWRDRRGAA